MSSDGRRCVVIEAGSIELRRQLGPTAWVVFEELLLASTGRRADCVATVSVRALAGELGLAKDTVARALVRLRRAWLVTARQSRSDAGGPGPRRARSSLPAEGASGASSSARALAHPRSP